MPLTSSIFVSINANRNLFFVSLSPSLFFFPTCLLLVAGTSHWTGVRLSDSPLPSPKPWFTLDFFAQSNPRTLRNKTPWFDHKLNWFVPWILWTLALFIAKPIVHNSQKNPHWRQAWGNARCLVIYPPTKIKGPIEAANPMHLVWTWPI